MFSTIISGITYECDGVNLRALANDQTFGPAAVSTARTLENGSVYIVIGALHVVLTKAAWALLMGWPAEEVVEEAAPEAPVEEVVAETTSDTVAEETPVVEEATSVAEEATPVVATTRRGRRRF
jgi:hypothetical protein